jgi:hypothetical protein
MTVAPNRLSTSIIETKYANYIVFSYKCVMLIPSTERRLAVLILYKLKYTNETKD